MAITEIERATGLASSSAIKAPAYLASTGNLTLSGEQTIDGVVTAESRVLLKDQTDATQNGVWITSTGDWTRAPDFANNRQIAEGTRVWVTDGTANAQSEWVLTSPDPEIDTDNLTFVLSTLVQNATSIHNAPAKTTLADADEVGIWDSLTGLFKRITWANIKTVLKAYFDTIYLSIATAASTYLPLVGGTLTGNLTVTKATPTIHLNAAAAAQTAQIALQTNGSNRWIFYKNNTAEAGANAGSDLNLNAYDDAGALLGAAITVTRSTRTTQFGGIVDLGNNGQIKFPATQNPSSDANTLDDYEEGTFTPTMTFGGSATGVTYVTQAGHYIKIGKFVHVQMNVRLSSNGSGVGAAVIAGLPFSSANVSTVCVFNCANWSGCSSIVGNITGYVTVNASTFNVLMSGAAASAVCTDTNITDSANLYFSGSYMAAA